MKNEVTEWINQVGSLIRQQKILKEKETDLREKISEAISDIDLSSISTKEVTITKVTKKNYTYSKKIQEKERELKVMKQQEEEYGVATYVLKSHYMYTLNKDIENNSNDI